MKRWNNRAARGVIAVVSTLLLLFTGSCKQQDTGSISIRVLDGWTEAPIAHARVVIPETGSVLETDDSGRTALISVPVVPDAHFQRILPQDWGTVTVLVYAEGYYACALYHARVTADTARENLPVRLFPQDGTLDVPFSVIEAPDDDWVAEMLRRYGP